MNWRRISRGIPFPAEVVSKTPRLVWHGCESLWVEQHQGIVTYQQDCLRFRTVCGLLTIYGRNLELNRYGAEQALVKGEILSVNYPEGEGHGTGETAIRSQIQSGRPEP